MKNYTIIIDEDAEKDLLELYTYIAVNDLIGKAEFFLKQILQEIESLKIWPERGLYPRELKEKGIFTLQEIYCKSYRIIYGIAGDAVIIVGVLDGRRDLKKILLKRLSLVTLEPI